MVAGWRSVALQTWLAVHELRKLSSRGGERQDASRYRCKLCGKGGLGSRVHGGPANETKPPGARAPVRYLPRLDSGCHRLRYALRYSNKRKLKNDPIEYSYAHLRVIQGRALSLQRSNTKASLNFLAKPFQPLLLAPGTRYLRGSHAIK